MSASAAIHSYGTTLAYSTTSNGSYTTVAEITELDEDFNVPEFKVTNFASPSATHEYKPKLCEPGESSFKANYISAVYSALLGIQAARSQYYWRITTPENSVAQFFGHISKCKRTEPDDDGIKIDVTIKRSGPITFTP